MVMLLHFRTGLIKVINQEISTYIQCCVLGFITNSHVGFRLIFFVHFCFRKKFYDADDIIRLPFVIGSFSIGSKTWWHELICSKSSFSSTI